MGLLDRNNRIIDLILTNEGKKLRGEGKLNFAYFTVSDEEVDYNPFISNSGSLSGNDLTSSMITQIEETNVSEAVGGYRYGQNKLGLDQTNIIRPLFTVPQGQTTVPKLVKVHRTGSVTLTINQQKIQDIYLKRDSNGNTIDTDGPVVRGFQRFNPSLFTFDYRYTPESFPENYPLEGLKITLFISGTDGMIEVDSRYDLNDDLSFRNDLKVVSSAQDVEKKIKRGDRKT